MKYYLPVTLVFLLITAILLYAFGREPICTCGYVSFWVGNTQSSRNSQQIADPYTFTHISHGLLFFILFTSFVFKKLSFKRAFLLSLLIESVWEVIENTPFIIDKYRAQTISLNYYGDTILNSLCDILAMVLGFYIAGKLPKMYSIALFILLEVVLLFAIRDNLTLNIIMLIYPVKAIATWQAG